MADLDEDITKSTPPGGGDVDLSDEIQDFRFLSSFSSYNDTQALPRRGEKDFEPHGTTTQLDVLAASKDAMHNALSSRRLHSSKNWMIGILGTETGITIIEAPKGTLFRVMGSADRKGNMVLLPEEAIYLLERGSLDVRLRQENGMEERGLEGLPLSLQSIYALLVGRFGLSLERYSVYSGLKRSGYIVSRSPTWFPENFDKDVIAKRSLNVSLFKKLFEFLFVTEQKVGPPLGPVVRPGLYRNYSQIYRSLNIIPFHDPSLPTDKESGQVPNTMTSDSEPPLRCCYHVWKPNTTFKKSAPPPPDFRICVINARETNLPDLSQLDGLFQSLPYAPPPPNMDKRLYPKLKHGYRNVILAVVDQGVVSYIQLSDAGFGKEKIYEPALRGGGGKRGGFGGRGRGRGK